MDQRSLQWRVGVVVLSALLLTGILIVRFSDVSTPFQTAQVLNAHFDHAPGVTVGTPVRKSGILIGRVTNVEFSHDPAGIIVRLEITRPDAELREGEVCRIKSSILGDAALEFVPGDSPKGLGKLLTEMSPEEIGTLKGVWVPSPLDMAEQFEEQLNETLSSFAEAGGAVKDAGGQVEKLAANINRLLEGDDPEQINRIMNKTETALESFNGAMDSVNKLLGDDELGNGLAKTMEDLPQLMEKMNRAAESVEQAMARAENNLKNLEGLTEPLGERGDDIARKLDGALSDFESVMSQLNQFTEGINSDEGTLGQLINNPQLYNEISSAVSNINQITKDIRPTIKSLEVFADKIARDPGRLGVSGAIRKQERTKFPNYPQVQPPPIDWRDPPELGANRLPARTPAERTLQR